MRSERRERLSIFEREIEPAPGDCTEITLCGIEIEAGRLIGPAAKEPAPRSVHPAYDVMRSPDGRKCDGYVFSHGRKPIEMRTEVRGKVQARPEMDDVVCGLAGCFRRTHINMN